MFADRIKFTNDIWAKVYIILRLLGEGKLYTADKLLRKNYKNYLDVLKIIRQEYDAQVLEYIIDEDNSLVTIKIQETGKILATIPSDEFKENAAILFEGIKNVSSSSVPAPDTVCEFAKIIYVNKPKAPAVKALKKQFGGKNDIFIEVRDGQTAIVSIMGFSIKSKFGQNPTLFNAGTSSQFLYKLDGCDDEKMNKFNSLMQGNNRDWEKCKTFLKEEHIGMKFIKTKNPVYGDNLYLIRESMADIIAWCVKDRLIDFSDNYQVKETVERMIKTDPLGVPRPDVYYEKAIKDFLSAAFSGMDAENIWDGKEIIRGGYIISDNEDTFYYHTNYRENFRDFLYRNTHFEYVSTEKHKCNYIEKDGNEYVLPLNVSVRFNTKIR